MDLDAAQLEKLNIDLETTVPTWDIVESVLEAYPNITHLSIKAYRLRQDKALKIYRGAFGFPRLRTLECPDSPSIAMSILRGTVSITHLTVPITIFSEDVPFMFILKTLRLEYTNTAKLNFPDFGDDVARSVLGSFPHLKKLEVSFGYTYEDASNDYYAFIIIRSLLEEGLPTPVCKYLKDVRCYFNPVWSDEKTWAYIHKTVAAALYSATPERASDRTVVNFHSYCDNTFSTYKEDSLTWTQFQQFLKIYNPESWGEEMCDSDEPGKQSRCFISPPNLTLTPEETDVITLRNPLVPSFSAGKEISYHCIA